MKGRRLRLQPALKLLWEKQKFRWEEHEELVDVPPGILSG